MAYETELEKKISLAFNLKLKDFPGGLVLRFHAPNARGLGLIPGQGTKFHRLQLRVHMLQLRTGVTK